jgi:hypothetical protein
LVMGHPLARSPRPQGVRHRTVGARTRAAQGEAGEAARR